MKSYMEEMGGGREREGVEGREGEKNRTISSHILIQLAYCVHILTANCPVPPAAAETNIRRSVL